MPMSDHPFDNVSRLCLYSPPLQFFVERETGESLGAVLVARDSFRHGAVWITITPGSATSRAKVQPGDALLVSNGCI